MGCGCMDMGIGIMGVVVRYGVCCLYGWDFIFYYFYSLCRGLVNKQGYQCVCKSAICNILDV